MTLIKKRFLMCLAIVGILLIPSMATAGNAVATNKWMTEVPNGTEMIAADDTAITASFAPVRGDGQSIKRNQKFYIAFYDDDNDVHVNQGGVVATCTENSTCASAPLFIASDTALICTDGDIGNATADDTNTIRVSICADSTCTAAKSVVHGALLAEAPTTACGVGGGMVGIAQPNIGGQWIYVELVGAPDIGDEVLVWVAGR
tara:strand:+ start:97 stop:705 length:609 start_codon:yes stop_codon:yes gene_type:complete